MLRSREDRIGIRNLPRLPACRAPPVGLGNLARLPACRAPQFGLGNLARLPACRAPPAGSENLARLRGFSARAQVVWPVHRAEVWHKSHSSSPMPGAAQGAGGSALERDGVCWPRGSLQRTGWLPRRRPRHVAVLQHQPHPGCTCHVTIHLCYLLIVPHDTRHTSRVACHTSRDTWLHALHATPAVRRARGRGNNRVVHAPISRQRCTARSEGAQASRRLQGAVSPRRVGDTELEKL